MRTFIRTGFVAAFVLALAIPTVALSASEGSTALASTRAIPSSGTTSIRPSPLGSDAIQQPELRSKPHGEEGAGSFTRPRPGFKNGKFPKKPLDAPTVPSSAVAGSNPELDLSVERA